MPLDPKVILAQGNVPLTKGSHDFRAGKSISNQTVAAPPTLGLNTGLITKQDKYKNLQ